MLNEIQIMTATEFHLEPCKRTVGPRGGVKEQITRWRRNGKTKVWKRPPLRFRVPIKYGFKGPYDYITEQNRDCFHALEHCPLNK
jgi:hypothetical protein